MKNRIQIIKLIDRILGKFLIRVIPSKKPTTVIIEDPSRILVVRPGGIGDAALLVPILKMVNVRYPSIQIDVLCEPRNEGAFQALSFIGSIYSYQKPIHFLNVLKKHYDVIVDTEQSHFLSAVVCRLLNSSLTMGYEAYGRGRMFHYAESYDHGVYEAEMFLKLFRHCFDLPKTVTWSNNFFKKLKENQGQRLKALTSSEEDLVCFFPGATISERLWPDNRWADVVDFISHKGLKPILLGGRMETLQCNTIQALCKNSRVINMCGKLSLLETAWLFRQSKLLVSTDSGILHIGVLCGIPTVSLFGSGIQEKWAPKEGMHRVVSCGLSCSPCTHYGTTPPCPDNRCMKNITAADVIDAVNLLLEQIKAGD